MSLFYSARLVEAPGSIPVRDMSVSGVGTSMTEMTLVKSLNCTLPVLIGIWKYVTAMPIRRHYQNHIQSSKNLELLKHSHLAGALHDLVENLPQAEQVHETVGAWHRPNLATAATRHSVLHPTRHPARHSVLHSARYSVLPSPRHPACHSVLHPARHSVLHPPRHPARHSDRHLAHT
jgi:hypothetical protein